MPDDALFPLGVPQPKTAPPGGTPRVQAPVRNQVEFVQSDLDSLIEDDHQVRVVWAFVEAADLSALYEPIRAFEGQPGRTPIDPRILLALWLYATLRAVGSARQLDQLRVEHIAYRWLCGGVPVNYHTLADFRSESGGILERVMIGHIAALRAAGLVTMDRVAHDGVRVRASAGTGSFRGKETLEALRQEAQEQVAALRRELHDDPKGSSARQKAARSRAAKERLERVQAALEQLPDVEAKKKDKKKKARVSTTDADARKMKMPNGGFNPAFNVQLSADTGSQIIVGADVNRSGSDHGLLVAAAGTVKEQSGCAPKDMLADGGFGKPESVEALAKDRIRVYAPPAEYKDKDGKVLEPKKDEAPEIKAWRERMKTDEAKAIYKERAATIECVNALARNRGLQQFRVRGLEPVRAVVLLFVLAHNLMRAATLMARMLTG